MKTSLIAASVLAAAVAMPTFAFAQSSDFTRAQVNSQLVSAERAGVNANTDPKDYPQDIQGAVLRAAVMQGPATAGSAGASMSGSSASGRGGNSVNALNQRDPNGYNRP